MTALSSIPSIDGREIAELLAPQGASRQPMPGFDADYADIVDYIVRCTHRIWEQKDVGLIASHYAADCRIHLMTGPVEGVDNVIAGTLRTLTGFPDRTLMGEAVIWSEEATGRYLSSHRIRSQGLNLGPTEFGAPTRRRAAFTTIADCLCERNLIVEEWLVRDNSAMLLDLGLDVRAVAAAQAERDRAAAPPAAWRRAEMERVRAAAVRAPDRPLPDAAVDPIAFARALFAGLWGGRHLDLVRTAYDVAARWRGPGGRRLFGHGEITGWLIALLGGIGDAAIAVDHVAANPCDGGWDVAVRWSLAGTHDGDGVYGPASGQPVYILAVTHLRIAGGRIVAEDLVFDEVALLRQIEGGL